MTTTAVAPVNHELILAGPVGSLDSYIHAVGAIPVLSREDEQALSRRFLEQDDLDDLIKARDDHQADNQQSGTK